MRLLRIIKSLTLCGIIVACCWVAAVYADNGTAQPVISTNPVLGKASSGTTVSLHLSASVKNDDIEVGNLVLLQVSLANTSGSEISLISQGDPSDNFNITVKDRQGKDVSLTLWGKSLFKYKHPPDYLPTANSYEAVPANSKKTYQFALNRVFDLSIAGAYSVTVSRAINLGPGKEKFGLTSETVIFRVHEPLPNFSDPDSFQLR